MFTTGCGVYQCNPSPGLQHHRQSTCPIRGSGVKSCRIWLTTWSQELPWCSCSNLTREISTLTYLLLPSEVKNFHHVCLQTHWKLKKTILKWLTQLKLCCIVCPLQVFHKKHVMKNNYSKACFNYYNWIELMCYSWLCVCLKQIIQIQMCLRCTV